MVKRKNPASLSDEWSIKAAKPLLKDPKGITVAINRLELEQIGLGCYSFSPDKKNFGKFGKVNRQFEKL